MLRDVKLWMIEYQVPGLVHTSEVHGLVGAIMMLHAFVVDFYPVISLSYERMSGVRGRHMLRKLPNERIKKIVSSPTVIGAYWVFPGSRHIG